METKEICPKCIGSSPCTPSTCIEKKHKMMKLNIPQEIRVIDYHDFYEIQHWYKLLNKNINVTEVGFDDRDYIGLIWIDEKDLRESQKLWIDK